MRFVMFYHSLVSDWNHGNAHFLRGVCSELLAGGHEVQVYEPRDGWSLNNLRYDHGEEPLRKFSQHYPRLQPTFYDPQTLQLDPLLQAADIVLVHEWNPPELVKAIGEHRSRHNYRLLFHDTHHRAVTAPEQMSKYDLSNYDGVLAFGDVLCEVYLKNGWANDAWTWHEAADTRRFRPLVPEASGGEATAKGDLVWIGNWGDDERSEELRECLVETTKQLRLNTRVYGVRYPGTALRMLHQAGIEYGGWLPNFEAPAVFAHYRATMHIPRRPYRELLTGIPTIRVFEALACGIPLVCLHWEDSEQLFSPGEDYLVAKQPEQMAQCVRDILNDPALAQQLATSGLQTILAGHTCAHRVAELLAICRRLRGDTAPVSVSHEGDVAEPRRSVRSKPTSAPVSR